MGGWVDGWVGGWMDGWMETCVKSLAERWPRLFWQRSFVARTGSRDGVL